MPNDRPIIYGASGQPVGAHTIEYPLGPNLLTFEATPAQLLEASLRSADAKDMVKATWASASSALMNVGEYLGRFEIRMAAMERVMAKDPAFKAVYEAEMQAVAQEMQRQAAQAQGTPGGQPTH